MNKLLELLPEKRNQAAVSIEMFFDLNTIAVEEVIGWLHVFKQHSKAKQIMGSMGCLMPCEEDWEA